MQAKYRRLPMVLLLVADQSSQAISQPRRPPIIRGEKRGRNGSQQLLVKYPLDCNGGNTVDT